MMSGRSRTRTARTTTAAALAAHPASAYGSTPRLAGTGDALMTKCKTEDCDYGPKPRKHGDRQWKCGGMNKYGAMYGCNKTASCTQCRKGGAACSGAGVCFAILDPELLRR